MTPFLLLLGCPPSDGPCSSCELTDAQNYSYTSTLDLEIVELAPTSDVVIDWSDLTQDLNGLPIEDGQIDELKLVVFENLSYDELIQGLEQDSLVQSEATVFATCETTSTRCSLSEFALFDRPLDVDEHFIPERGLWLVALGTNGTQGMLAGVILQAVDGETATEARVTDESGVLDADIDLSSLTPLQAQAFPEIGWADVEHDVLGRELRIQTIDRAVIGRYELPLEELEGRIAEIRTLSTDVWETPIQNTTSLELADLEGFQGLDSDGTWLMALECSQCTHPAPPVLTVLEGP